MKIPLYPFARLGLLGAALLFFGDSARAQTNTAFLVLPTFANSLAVSPAINPSDQNSLALFSGTLGEYSPPGSGLPAAIPASAEGIQLAGCSFGQMFAMSVPFPDFELATIKAAQELLYPPVTATNRDQVAGSGAAFRYKDLLYSGSNTTVRADFESISTWFGDPERQAAREGIAVLRNALKYSPLHKQLRNALLDAYYDFIVAEAQHVKSSLAEVAMYRLGFVTVPTGKFIIDYEITGYTNILRNYEGILDEYGKLFLDRGGVNVSQLDASAPPGITLGQWIFQQEQPQRNQMAAQFRDANGILTTVPLQGTTNSMLFAGYKDYVALLGVMRDYAQSAAELAQLYGMRRRAATQEGQKDDTTLGFELIENINQELLLDASLLRALLPNAVPPATEPDVSGARAALSGVLAATAELTKVGLFLNSQVNILGYDPDFLALISTFESASQEHLWDSYDALRGWLDSPNESSSILGRARNAYAAAFASYNTYRGYADQVSTEMTANENSYAQRYKEICGYLPGDPPDPYPTPVPAGHYPEINTNVPPSHCNNPRTGSELRQVHVSIEQSNTKEASLTNLAAILAGQRRVASERLDMSIKRTNAINEATIVYAGVIATERDNITQWSANQAFSQASYDTVSDVMSVLGSASPDDLLSAGIAAGVTAAAGAVNIAVQTQGETEKGNSQKEMDLAAASFEKSLAMADAEQNVYQAGEEGRNIDREMQSLVMTMQDNRFVRAQDLERIDGLQREMQQLKVLRDQNDSRLANRYYADPIHFLRAQNAMIQADFTFRSAQRWVFLAARALEYKYNQAFVYTESTPGSPRWELSSLFKLRNAMELDDFISAMDSFNLGNLGKLNGRDAVTESISLKNDFWGRTYTTAPERLAQFRKRIAEGYDAKRGVYVLKLNTLRLTAELENGSLFSGAEYDLNGDWITAGFYLDKIEWIKIKFVDSNESSPVAKTADLSYGGTCFVRPPCASAIGGGLESTNELRSFPFRYYSMGTDPDTGVLEAESSPEQRATIRVAFWNQPDKTVEPNDDFADTFWKERSVAITDLNLTIAGSKVNTNSLQDIQIYIRHLYARRSICN